WGFKSPPSHQLSYIPSDVPLIFPSYFKLISITRIPLTSATHDGNNTKCRNCLCQIIPDVTSKPDTIIAFQTSMERSANIKPPMIAPGSNTPQPLPSALLNMVHPLTAIMITNII